MQPLPQRLQVVVGSLIAVWLALQVHSAFVHTPTHDEAWHLPIGLAIWETGQFDQDRINPPLVRLIASMPYRLFGGSVDFAGCQSEADYARRFVKTVSGDDRVPYAWGRIAMALLTLGGGLLLAQMAGRAFGPTASLLAVLFYFTDPNIAAHGDLVTHDAPAAVAFVTILGSLLRYLETPTYRRASVIGLALAFGLLCKFTALIWCPIIAVAVLAPCIREGGQRILASAGALGICVLVAVLVVNSCYLFDGFGEPLGKHAFESVKMKSVAGVGLGALPMPLPRDFILGVDQMFHIVEQTHTSYLNGKWESVGFRSYYLMCWLYKTPLVLTLASVTGLVMAAMRFRMSVEIRRTLLLAIPATLAVVVPASFASNQLGYRYMLPVYPFMILFAAGGVGIWYQQNKTRQKSSIVYLVAFVSLLSLRYHPHHLTYFNEIAGGPRRGGEHLIDSNLDWGQSLHELRDYVAENDIQLDGLAYFGTYPPTELDLNVPLPPFLQPTVGTYAVSQNFVYGRPHVVTQPDGTVVSVPVANLFYFQMFEPQKVVGNSIAVYEITADDVELFNSVAQEMMDAGEL